MHLLASPCSPGGRDPTSSLVRRAVTQEAALSTVGDGRAVAVGCPGCAWGSHPAGGQHGDAGIRRGCIASPAPAARSREVQGLLSPLSLFPDTEVGPACPPPPGPLMTNLDVSGLGGSRRSPAGWGLQAGCLLGSLSRRAPPPGPETPRHAWPLAAVPGVLPRPRRLRQS